MQWIEAAIAAFADWQAQPHRRTPREAVARAVPREAPATERARVAAAVYGAVRDQRRLLFALDVDLDARDDLAAVLVLAHCVAGGAVTPAAAAARTELPAAVFARLADVEARLATIVDPAERFAVRHSLPDWLAALLLREFGEDAERVVTALGEPPPRVLRANRLRGDRAALAAALAEAGISTAPGRFAADALEVAGDDDVFATAAYRDGAFEQQDEGSQLIAQLLAPPPRGRVLDACAGSGGKTLAIAALLGNAGEVLAADVHAPRLQGLRQRARRAGAHNVRAVQVEATGWSPEVERFARAADRILLDVPCSGTGSWRRRPEARWTLTPHDLPALQRVQDELLDRAAAALRPGARIVYATCSLLAAENEERVAAALARHPELEPVRPAEILGGAVAAPITGADGAFLKLRPDTHGTDGFFAAVLRRPRR